MGACTIWFDLARGSPAALEVFDVSGRRVSELARRDFAPDRHSVAWDASDGRDEVALLAKGACAPGRYQTVWNGRTDQGPVPAGL